MEIKEETHKIFSFVQCRGSMPFLWSQTPDLKCVPKVEINPSFKQNCDLFEKHIRKLNEIYGEIIILNLIDKKRIQKKLGEFLEKIIRTFKYSFEVCE